MATTTATVGHTLTAAIALGAAATTFLAGDVVVDDDDGGFGGEGGGGGGRFGGVTHGADDDLHGLPQARVGSPQSSLSSLGLDDSTLDELRRCQVAWDTIGTLNKTSSINLRTSEFNTNLIMITLWQS